MSDTLVMSISERICYLIYNSYLLIVSVLFFKISLQCATFNKLFFNTKPIAVNIHKSLITHNTRVVQSLTLFELTLQGIS